MSSPASDLKQPDDVLIVGGGSAGATLAARLSEDPNRRVLCWRPVRHLRPTSCPPSWVTLKMCLSRLSIGVTPHAEARRPPRWRCRAGAYWAAVPQ
jgi:choline dehydrogenase-like flavoprotein